MDTRKFYTVLLAVAPDGRDWSGLAFLGGSADAGTKWSIMAVLVDGPASNEFSAYLKSGEV